MLQLSQFIPQAFYYRLNWRSQGLRPGGHASKTLGGNADFRGHQRFLNHPDPKRIDVRRSLMSVPNTLMVRTFYERSAIKVFAVIDTSSSMGFVGDTKKWNLVAEVASAIAWSAARQGDAFGLLASDDELRMDLFEPASSQRGLAANVYEKLIAATLKQQATSGGLPQLAAQLPTKRALVFLISDFHLDLATLKNTLQAIATHDVLPIVMWDSAEFEHLPTWGWARVRDMETGQDAPLFMRPKLQQSVQQAYHLKRKALIDLCRKSGLRKPFFIGKKLDVTQLNQHLFGQI